MGNRVIDFNEEEECDCPSEDAHWGFLHICDVRPNEICAHPDSNLYWIVLCFTGDLVRMR
jgi:hypothetical protein